MKLLILGGNGMAGHILVDYFKRQGKHKVWYTTRDLHDQDSLYVDVAQYGTVEKLVEIVRPNIIINAIGVLNQFANEDKINAYAVNGFLPHRLRRLADMYEARLIHISTDCVFEGTKGSYTEEDEPDGTSTYALTKMIGEVKAPGHLTIRTSIIGPEIRNSAIGLLHWFLSQTGTVSGYRQVIWNGVTTLELAKAVDAFLDSEVSGLIHLTGQEPINKHELLTLIQQVWAKQDVTIIPQDTPICDKSLICTRKDITYQVPSYKEMLEELKEWNRTI